MPLLEFQSCRQRIRRAESHSEAIRDLWNKRIFEDDLYTPGVSVDDKGEGRVWIQANHGTDFTNTLSLELGEMLYQLRSTLDGCIYASRVRETRQDPPPNENKLEFPICEKPSEYRSFDRAPLEKKRRDIIESVQPYNVPKLSPDLLVYNFNRALGILTNWARVDRHRRVHVVGSWASKASPKIICPQGTILASTRVVGSGFLDDECEIATFRVIGFRPGMEVKANPDVFLDIVVNEPPPPCSDTDTLGNRMIAMIKATEFVIDSLEASF